ncbi:MAG: hypothetical protein EBT04_16745 [Betaproteobacteria bacterium]|nr:hypothetical protein [Betaproteobacteria bacterium]
MWKTENQRVLEEALKQLVEDEGTAYAAGYLSSFAVSMLADLPKRKQKAEIAQILRHNADYKVTVRHLLTGEEVEIRRGDRGTVLDPSMERYHTM